METYTAGAVFYPTLNGAPLGRVGTITYSIETTDNEVVQVDDTALIVETSPGSYTATRTVPVDVGTYVSVWFDPDYPDLSATEEFRVVVRGLVEAGLYYASPDDVRLYLDKTESDPGFSDEDLIRVIRSAQRDIDTAVGGWLPYDDTGLKFASNDQTYDVLTTAENLRLTEATCAQVEYRLLVGEDFMTKDQYESESGPDSTVVGSLRKVSSTSYSLLQQAGLLHLWGRTRHKRINSFNNFGRLRDRRFIGEPY